MCREAGELTVDGIPFVKLRRSKTVRSLSLIKTARSATLPALCNCEPILSSTRSMFNAAPASSVRYAPASRSEAPARRETTETHPRYRPDIDGLRAIAVLAVIAFHAAPAALPGGFVGVDIFFVISGYLIGSILLAEMAAGRFSFVRFYSRRVKRIFPALIIVLLACYAFGWFNLIDTEFMELGKHVAAGAAFVANLALWSEAGYFDSSAATKPLLHLWSLGVEEQFYIFWPVMLWAFQKGRINPLIGIIAVALGSFAADMVTVVPNPTADFYSPLARFWELLIGCLLAYQHLRASALGTSRGSLFTANMKSVIGCVLILASIVFLRGQVLFPGWRALLPTVGAYLLIDSGTATFNRKILAAKPLVWIGLISFPLYLWHWPLLVYPRILEGGTPEGWVRACAVFASFVLAWATYRLIERPLRFGKPSQWKVVVLVGLMAIVGFVGFNTYQRHGLSFRLTKMVGQFAGVQRDISASWRTHSCFLEGSTDNADTFNASCTDQGNQPLVFLWGDSHAAALYPGLRALQPSYDFRLAQYTASGCVPLLGTDAPNPRCESIHNRAFEFLKHDHPKMVILTADWSVDELSRLDRTVAAMRQAGVQQIVMVGPVPRWHESLPKVYWTYWRKYHATLPARTRFGLDPTIAPIDQQAQIDAERLHLIYVSAYQKLCDNVNGCDTRSGPGKGQILVFDDAHLTVPGSLSLMQSLAPSIFGSRFAK
jgi:peptidoglycan/LPS O-acetylase OafA/YrhL